MTEEEQAQRGLLAEQILENPLWTEVWSNLRQLYLHHALKCDTKDDLGRFRLMEAIRQVDTTKAHFEAIFAQGQLAKDELKKMESPRKVIRLF